MPALQPVEWVCEQCSKYADCLGGVCVCKDGWMGDGNDCRYNCEDDLIWTPDGCVAVSAELLEDDGN